MQLNYIANASVPSSSGRTIPRLGKAFEKLRVGPAAMDLDVGPLIRQTQQQRVWDFLSDAQVAGIPMVAQGVVVDEAPETGYYQAPTLLRDVPLPFGGVKSSGYGREKGFEALYGFTTLKTVAIKYG
eukprot:gene871-853_t